MMPVFDRFNEFWCSVLPTCSYQEVEPAFSTCNQFYIFDKYPIAWQLLLYVVAFTTVISIMCVIRSLFSSRYESSQRSSYYIYTHTNHEASFQGTSQEQRNQSDGHISIQEHQRMLLDEQRRQKILKYEIQQHIWLVERIRNYYERKLLEEQNKHRSAEKHYQHSLQREKMKQTLAEEQWKIKFQEQQQQQMQLLEKILQEIQECYNYLKENSKQLVRLTSLLKSVFPYVQRHLSQATLNNNLATNWDPMPPNKAFIRVAIKEDTDEFINVKDHFKSNTQKRLEIIKIERVQNAFLLGSYMLKKLEMENICGASNVIEINLFHGTKASNVESICENNFNWRLHGENVGNRYGRGVSFTPFWHYASHYSDKYAVKVMFLVRVLISELIIGNQNMEIPPLVGSSIASNNLRFDATTKNDLSVIVKYSDNEFYPQYLIYYSAPKRKRNGKHNINNKT